MAAPYDGPIVDAHHHLWRYDGAAYPWLARPEQRALARSFLPADYRAAVAGHNIVGSVWIEALAADPLAEARQAQSWADCDPGLCSAIIAHCPLDALDVEARLDLLQQSVPNLRGIRDIISWRSSGRSHARSGILLSDPEFFRGLRVLSRRGLSFDLMVLPQQMEGAAQVVAQLPDLRVIIEHAGSPEDRTSHGLQTWRAGLARLAELPNTATKISALHCLDPDWTLETIRADIEQVVALFGVDRTCFATDFPVHDRSRPAGLAIDDFKAATGDLSVDEQGALFCRTACRLYRLDDPLETS